MLLLAISSTNVKIAVEIAAVDKKASRLAAMIISVSTRVTCR